MDGCKITFLSENIDIEKPAESSEPCEFLVQLSNSTDRMRQTRIPVHLRYQAPNEKRLARVSIPAPVVCSTCAIEDFQKAKEQSDFCEKQYGPEYKMLTSEASVWREDQTVFVPVGDPAKTMFIVISTAIVVCSGVVVIIRSTF